MALGSFRKGSYKHVTPGLRVGAGHGTCPIPGLVWFGMHLAIASSFMWVFPHAFLMQQTAADLGPYSSSLPIFGWCCFVLLVCLLVFNPLTVIACCSGRTWGSSAVAEQPQ